MSKRYFLVKRKYSYTLEAERMDIIRSSYYFDAQLAENFILIMVRYRLNL